MLWTNRTGATWGSLGGYEIHGSNDLSGWTLLGSGTAQTGITVGEATLTLMVSSGSAVPVIMMQQLGAGFGPHKSQQLGGLLQ